ncbi:MAG: aminotransferase class I/II-fold pyridoxal phosphate-dependent enzyme [Planctomycetes bacterium]|nr:aminotransferase class I/II-fold pyridoxal phosphate-dependent enzyme [Planctomycetota bacterium]
MLSKRALKIEASEIRKAFDLARSLKDPIDLSIGQPDFEVPDAVKNAAIDSIKQGFNRYVTTQGIPELRDKLIQKFTQRFGFAPGGLMVTSGVAGAIVLCLMVILEDGDEVIITDPYFAMYKHIIHITGGLARYANTYPDFKLKREAFEKVITPRTKAIIITTPCNPTGIIYSREEIMMVVDICKKNNLLLISDEVYRTFVFDTEVASAVKYYDKVLLADGFSKSYGMPGWRMGYAAGPAELIERMAILQQWSFICAPGPFQKAGVVALDTDMSPIIREFHRRRDIVYETLKPKFKMVKPQGAFYIFPEAPGNNASEFVKKAAQNNVLIVPGLAFSEQNTHFRISYAVTEPKLRKGLEILLNIV